MTTHRLAVASAILCSAAALLVPVDAAGQLRAGLWSRDQESLRLVRHDVQVSIEHPVAATTVTQEFENPYVFNVEAFFYYPVPAGATVSGLALWVNGARREARMLERQKAREIYDGIVRQKRNPALLERLDGNTFRIRIFPVLARSRTRVELRFVQPVEQDGPGRHRYTLRRPPGQVLHVLRFGARLATPFGVEDITLEGYDGRFLPSSAGLVLAMPAAARSFRRDIHLRYRARGAQPVAAVAATTHGKERIFVAEIPDRQQPAARGRRVAVLLDASTTMRPHLQQARSLVAQILDGLSATDEVAVVPFDLLPRTPATLSRVDDAARAAARRLLARTEARGGTAFVPVFEQAIAAGARQIICITDGGSRLHQDELEHLARRLFDRPDVQVSLIAAPGSRAEEPLRDAATVGGGHYQRLEAGVDLVALSRRLLQLMPRQAVQLEGRGTIDLARRDAGRLVVTGAVPEAQHALTVRPAGGEQVAVALPATAPDGRALRALYAAAAIDAQMRRIKLFGETPEQRCTIVQLSQQHNVVSEYTALLATETDADYQRPTSGRQWQRMTPKPADDLPSTFQSTPEPHEWALIGLGLALLWLARRRWPGVASRPA